MAEPNDPVYGEIKVSLRGLYHAGRVTLPEKADQTADAAGSLAIEIDSLDALAAQAGNPKPLLDALTVCHRVYQGLRTTVANLNYGAEGLIHMADDFSKTDELAAQAHDHLSQRLTDGPPPALPDRLAPMENPVTGGEQPPEAPATPEQDREDRDDAVGEPDLPDVPEAE